MSNLNAFDEFIDTLEFDDLPLETDVDVEEKPPLRWVAAIVILHALVVATQAVWRSFSLIAKTLRSWEEL